METQTVINAVFAGFGAIVGAVIKSIWDAVKDLQSADKGIVQDVSQLQILVAGNYIRKDEFNRMVGTLFDKLDRIDAKLDTKANVADCPARSHISQ